MWLVTTSGIVASKRQPEPAAEHLRVVTGVLVVAAVPRRRMAARRSACRGRRRASGGRGQRRRLGCGRGCGRSFMVPPRHARCYTPMGVYVNRRCTYPRVVYLSTDMIDRNTRLLRRPRGVHDAARGLFETAPPDRGASPRPAANGRRRRPNRTGCRRRPSRSERDGLLGRSRTDSAQLSPTSSPPPKPRCPAHHAVRRTSPGRRLARTTPARRAQ